MITLLGLSPFFLLYVFIIDGSLGPFELATDMYFAFGVVEKQSFPWKALESGTRSLTTESIMAAAAAVLGQWRACAVQVALLCNKHGVRDVVSWPRVGQRGTVNREGRKVVV